MEGERKLPHLGQQEYYEGKVSLSGHNPHKSNSLVIKNILTLKKTIFLPTVLIDQDQVPLPHLLLWIWLTTFHATSLFQIFPDHTHFNPEDGGSIFLQNMYIYLLHCMVSQPSRLQSELQVYLT
jgi:hypothetical protein